MIDNKGFTLIETLVAITVLLLSVSAPLSIAAKALFSAYYARDQITAYYLADEAIEYVKNARDTTFLNDVFGNTGQNAWLGGLGNCIDQGNGSFNGCYFEATQAFSSQSALSSCPSEGDGGCPKLRFCTDTKLWGHTAGCTESKFSRKVEVIPQLNNTTPNDEAIIRVTIEWPGQGISVANRTFILTGAMMNWERY